MRTYSTRWGESEVSVSADWGQANSPVKGVDGGRHAADFNHLWWLALFQAVEECAKAEGLDTENAEVIARIIEAVESGVESDTEWRT